MFTEINLKIIISCKKDVLLFILVRVVNIFLLSMISLSSALKLVIFGVLGESMVTDFTNINKATIKYKNIESEI